MLNRRILIVDDNVDIHADFRKILTPKTTSDAQIDSLESQLFGQKDGEAASDCAYEVEFASQGQQALEMVEQALRDGKPYALIFMDVRMPPGWDGIETTKKIWERAPYSEVVLCTAYSDYTTDDILAVLGASHRLLFLKKPFDSVAVRQMALAVTTKWNFEADTRAHLANLENLVDQRTRELGATQQLLFQASKMSALGEMAGGVAHEINTPLAILSLNIEMMGDLIKEPKVRTEEMMEMNAVNEKTVARIGKIVEGLRKFSRDGSKDPLDPVPVNRLIQDVLALCQEKFKSHGVEVRWSELTDDICVACRPVELVQVILNLMNNAFDSITEQKEKWIRLEAGLKGPNLVISVVDSGSAISARTQEKMFQPFFTTKAVGKGTGLGLSISLGIMAAHGGTLTYDSHSPNSKFDLVLPAVAAEKLPA